MELVIKLLKPERRKSEKISALYLIIFMEMFVSCLALAESKLKISFKIFSLSKCEKEKKRVLLPVAYFFYFEYVWVTEIFCNGFNKWIVGVI